MTPVEHRGWACGLANSSSRDEARSHFLAFIRKQGGVVHLFVSNLQVPARGQEPPYDILLLISVNYRILK